MSNQDLTRRKFIRLTSTGIAATVVGEKAFGGWAKIVSPTPDAAHLSEVFMQPPADARPRCYWYWMDGNITRDGIRADLAELARVGVGGVNYFDIGVLPPGPVINQSAKWYELVNFAVEEAEKHNIRVSFNCPGWSGSGGPWITPELAMQELTWQETTTEGGREFSAVLPQPPTRLGYYRDAALLAFPTPQDDEPLPLPQAFDTNGKLLPQAALALQSQPVLPAPCISQAPGTIQADAAIKQDDHPGVDLPTEFDLVFPQPVQLRSLMVQAARASGSYKARLSAWDESKSAFRPIAHFASYAAGPFSTNIGSASFMPLTVSRVRLTFEVPKQVKHVRIEAIRTSGGFRVASWMAKAGFACAAINSSPSDCRPQQGDVIPLEQVIDLSGKMAADGTLNWQVPPGRWTILRIGQTPTGMYLFPTPVGGAGLDCDKLSSEAADFHYDRCVKPILKQLGPDLIGRATAYYHVDSYESGWQNWTVKFPQDFQRRRGYDLKKYMPALTGRVVGSLETTEKFLWDFRRTIGDLFADNNYGRLAQRCHEDGIRFSTEPYGGPFEWLQVGNRADHPMTEVWLPDSSRNLRKLTPEAVFSGRITGRKLIGAESFTSGPPHGGMWKDHPFSLKALGDYIFCSGINLLCMHVSTHQPLMGEHLRPGFTCGQNGIHFDRGETWWEHGAREWVTYITRCQTLLQAGEHVADVLYFQGNDSPSGVGPFEPPLPEGYDFDVCNGEILQGISMLSGQIVLACGKRYRYLVLPHHGRVTLASLQKIVSLARNGARIAGTLPRESPSLTDALARDEYRRLIGELSAHMRADQPFKDILAADNLAPDFSYDQDTGPVLHYIHRDLGDADCYFVASASPNACVVECAFRSAGRVPELWRADTGAIEPCAVYEHSGDITRIPLRFDPSGSVFVVFRKGPSNPHAISVSLEGTPAESLSALPAYALLSDGKNLELRASQSGRYVITMADRQRHLLEIDPLPQPRIVEGPWTLLFPPGWGAPGRVTLNKLSSWHESGDSGIRYFSGTATYKTTFPSPKTDSAYRLFLDLGRVEVIAEVWLNKKTLGVLWKPPFDCEVTGLVRPGENELEVRITNLWPNRLIGDEQFPDDCTKSGQWVSGVIPSLPEWLKSGRPRPEPRRLTFCTWKHWRRDDALLPSGLLGPVTLRQVRTLKIAGS